MKTQDLKEEEIRQILAQVAIALGYLHNELKISHRDLKPANILIFPNLRIKISDFGLAKLTEESKLSMTKCGTMKFSAPEILGTVRGASVLPFKADIYSLALTASWMMLKDLPDMYDIYQKCIPFKDSYSAELKEFVYFCLVRIPADRPDIN